MKNLIVFLLLTLLCISACEYQNKEVLYQDVEPEVCIDTVALFARDMIPLLQTHCNQCHRNDRQDGDINLEGYDNVKPYADDGSLYGSTNHEAGFEIMPPSGGKISFCEIEKMRLWIEAGALNN